MAANATERLKDEIENEIAAGRRLPGMRLDEVSLAARYGVSRTPIREALHSLAASGLIEVRPHRGAVEEEAPRRIGQREVLGEVEVEDEPLVAPVRRDERAAGRAECERVAGRGQRGPADADLSGEGGQPGDRGRDRIGSVAVDGEEDEQLAGGEGKRKKFLLPL